MIERDRREPSRELVKSRNDVTPSEWPLEDGFGAGCGVLDAIGVSLNGNLEVPCTNSGIRLAALEDVGGLDRPEDFLEGFLLEIAVRYAASVDSSLV